MGGIDSDFDFGPFIRHAPKVQKTKTGSLLMHMCIDDNEPLLPDDHKFWIYESFG